MKYEKPLRKHSISGGIRCSSNPQIHTCGLQIRPEMIPNEIRRLSDAPQEFHLDSENYRCRLIVVNETGMHRSSLG